MPTAFVVRERVPSFRKVFLVVGQSRQPNGGNPGFGHDPPTIRLGLAGSRFGENPANRPI
jgi:hypothetical protein